MFLPQFLTELLFKVPALNALSGSVRDVVFSVIEGLIRLVIFVAYVAICSCVPDVKRVFMYHGAEHKTINAFEHDEELTVENVQKYSTIHKRCGTTFMVLVMVVSIIVLAFAGWLTVDVFGWPNNAGIKFAVRIVMIPLVAGISYEILKLLALSDNIVVRIIRWPGLQLQRLTTRQPDDDMVEVAIVAFKTVYEMDADETIPERTFDIGKPYKDAREQVEKILPADKFDKSTSIGFSRKSPAKTARNCRFSKQLRQVSLKGRLRMRKNARRANPCNTCSDTSIFTTRNFL